MKLELVLVPLDGSPLAETALPKALELAEVTGARLLLVRAAEAHTLPGVDATEAQIRVVREAEEYLNRVAEQLRAGGRIVESAVWYGPAAEAIVEAARFHHADLIVMGTHGRSGLGRLVLGSVAESVLRGTHTSILLVRVAEAPLLAPPGRGGAVPWAGAAGTR